MEILENKINEFLSIDIIDDYGSGYDSDYNDYVDSGCGNGCVSGKGYGCGSGCGNGTNAYCGYGKGYGCGCDYGNGDCYGDVDNVGLKEMNGKKVYMVDEIQNIFTSIHGNVAQGFIVRDDLQLIPCFIVKGNNKFAHGSTLRDAFGSLQEKIYDDSAEEERIEVFKKKFPSYDEKYDNRDLFTYHHVLTGSCRMGREEFIKSKGLSLDGKTSVREFVELTKNAYGGGIIKRLAKEYTIS